MVSNSCGGTAVAAANDPGMGLANGAIPPSGSCSIVINVVGTAAGSVVNVTSAVASTNAASAPRRPSDANGDFCPATQCSDDSEGIRSGDYSRRWNDYVADDNHVDEP